MIKKLLPFIRGYERYIYLAPLFIVAEVFFEISIPFLMSRIVNIGVYGGDFDYIMKMGALMVGAAILSLIFGMTAGIFSARAAMGLGGNIRMGLFSHILDLSFSNTDRFSTPSLITRLTTDITNTQNAFMMALRMLVRAPVMLVCSTIMAAYINLPLSMVFLVAVPVLGVSLAIIMANAFPRFSAMLKKYDALNAAVQENLIAIRVVKSFVRGGYEAGRFDESADDLRRAQVRAEKLVILAMPIMMAVMFSSTVAISWFGGGFIIAGRMETGDLISFLSYVTQVLMSLMMLSMVFVMLVLSRASATRIIEALDEQPHISDEGADPDIVPTDGSAELRGVSFSYARGSGEPVLSDINLKIEGGQTVAIIGPTGAAKTSLVSLIPRLYDATEGSVLVGGRDVRSYTLKNLRGKVAVVLQKNLLFSGTIIDNLRWGNEDAGEEEIIEACRAAQAHDFIMAFPDGYNTMLGQGGVNLSGGQKQRLCIARALLKKPLILILDDSTSAVDTATDERLRRALPGALPPGATVIIIAQRVASVMEADRIIVLNNGRIEDSGNHAELMERCELYRDVYTSQQKGGR